MIQQVLLQHSTRETEAIYQWNLTMPDYSAHHGRSLPITLLPLFLSLALHVGNHLAVSNNTRIELAFNS
jgi:hypothetical protein